VATGIRDRTTFRREAFDAMAEPLGLKTITDKAKFLGLAPGTFHRVYKGGKGARNAGRAVINALLNAPWPHPVTYEDFFGDTP
jgi:hypothetical protein